MWVSEVKTKKDNIKEEQRIVLVEDLEKYICFILFEIGVVIIFELNNLRDKVLIKQ